MIEKFCAKLGDKFVAYLGVCEKFGDRRSRAKFANQNGFCIFAPRNWLNDYEKLT